jgi:hypothetical protein
MQEPTEEGEASIPTENVRETPNRNGKAAKHTLFSDLETGELNHVSLPQAVDIPAAKRPRLEEPSSASADEAGTKLSSHDTAVSLPAAALVAADPVKGTRATGRWTPEEDAKLNSAVTNTSKRKDGTKNRPNWSAIAAQVPGRTEAQCGERWRHVLDPSIDRANIRTGKWTEDESIKLNAAVETHGGKNWDKIAALVPGRTISQCRGRWRDSKAPRVTPGRTDEWTAVEDEQLKDAAQTHGGKNWNKISALVQGRTKKQCCYRWHNVLKPSIDEGNGRTGKWTEDEDSKLKDAVQSYGGKNWGAIAALVPGRTTSQCRGRWRDVVDPKINRTGKWSEDEDIKLKDALQTHGSKNWVAITALFPGRGKKDCQNRWHSFVDPSIDRTPGGSATWTEDEDEKLKDAVQTHGGKNWGAIAALVPGRTTSQCLTRWKDFLDPSIDGANERTGRWTADEDIKLKDSVQTHGGKNWSAIAALVPGRAQSQCHNRWYHVLDPSIDRTNSRTGKWTKAETKKLKDAVQTHGGKNWGEIAALVPDRTKQQCLNRWKFLLDPRVGRKPGRTVTNTREDSEKLEDAVWV